MKVAQVNFDKNNLRNEQHNVAINTWNKFNRTKKNNLKCTHLLRTGSIPST